MPTQVNGNESLSPVLLPAAVDASAGDRGLEGIHVVGHVEGLCGWGCEALRVVPGEVLEGC